MDKPDYIRGSLFVLALILMLGAEGGMKAETLTLLQGTVVGCAGIGCLAGACYGQRG